MARTLLEVDNDLAELETQFANLKAQLQAANIENRLVALEEWAGTTETRLSKVIKGLKAIFKRILPKVVDDTDAFDPWKARRQMDRALAIWLAKSDTEDDEI